MEITTKFDHKLGLRSHKVTGDVMFEEAERELAAIYKDPDFDPEMNALWDIRDAKLHPLTTGQIRDISKYVSRNWVKGKARSALVVSRDVDFGIARMIERNVFGLSSRLIMVFRDIDKALEWLGIE